jgi:maleylpyruvate isomerase
VKLFGYWRSSSAYRVRIALAYKGLNYENVPVHLVRGGGEQHLPEFAGKNPMQQVPLLELDDPDGPFRLSQSMAIIEYLDERFPEPPLLPADPKLRARARELAELVNAGIQPLQNLSVLAEVAASMDGKAFAKTFNERGLAALETLAATSAGKFLVGDDVSIADVFLVPQLYAARRFRVELEPFPTLLRVEKELVHFPAFRAAHPDRQPDAEPASGTPE